ncbi:rho GTPase-activating protein 22-like [Sphaeramia orbicularis]|uniref:rho GTPase-activating protein 22-like n=1 Tax=Sphaeramia orbicularis TaxID=375764 RepID=UPI00117E2A54|nr:rho GTPase-activating protein 22-like [Sphaeramia orbicularis]
MGLSCFKSWKHDSTGHKGNRDVLASPGSYFFLSNSAGQGDEWLKSLNKGAWIPFTGVFGQRLEETVLYERRYGVRLVPLVVEQCVTFIRERGLHEVGLFRQPGQASLVKELQEAFDAGERPSFDSSTDVHTVASLLKLYLRQLPEPPVPYNHYPDFLLCGRRLSTSDRMMGLVELRNLLHELPVANFNLLNFICRFLNEVQSYSSTNKMSCQNLATVFGPNILRAKAEDPQSIMGGAALVQVLMLELIREYEPLFSKVPPPSIMRPYGGLRGSPCASRQPQLHPPPCLRQLSLPLITERSRESGQAASEGQDHSFVSGKSDLPSCQKKRLGHRYTSSHPDNCFFPPPSSSPLLQRPSDQRSFRFQHHADQESSQASATGLQSQELMPEHRPVLLSWTDAWTGLCEVSDDFWSSVAAAGPPDEEGGVPEQASRGSSEAQEDSTPSAYDNLDKVSLHQTKDGITGGLFETGVAQKHGANEEKGDGEEAGPHVDSSSSWSSCEVLPLDESADAVDKVGPVKSPKRPTSLPSGRITENGIGDNDHRDNDDDKDEEGHHFNSPTSCSEASDSPLSTGSSEVFLPSGPPDLQGSEPQLQPRDPQSLLAELQRQMAQQKAEYQARIQRLERCNDVLERQVAVLRVSLEQQKRSQSVAEIKIRNMERAKADADRRNSTLQREMELFFQMYGEVRRRGGDEEEEEEGEERTSRDRVLQSL